MPKSRHRKKSKRAKRPSYAQSVPPASAGGLKSDLGKEIWAVINDDGVHGGMTHDQALAFAKEHGGTVTTQEAINQCD